MYENKNKNKNSHVFPNWFDLINVLTCFEYYPAVA